MLTVDISLPVNDSRTKMSAFASGIKEARNKFRSAASQLLEHIPIDQQNIHGSDTDQKKESLPQVLPIGRLLLLR